MLQPPPTPTNDPANSRVQRWDDIGLTLIHDFITADEEAAMVAAFHSSSPSSSTLESSNVRRRVSLHFGHHFDYTTFGASETRFTPVPDYISDLLPRLPLRPNNLPPQQIPDQFTAQYYPPGAGIPPHVDTHSAFGEALYSLSFGSAVPMVFRLAGANDARKMRLPKRSLTDGPAPVTAPEGVEHEDEHPAWELLLPPRSLLVMTGPSRYGYTHGIKGRKTDLADGRAVPRRGRYSITMRSVRRGADAGCCDCAYPGVCDARIREEMEAAAGERPA